MAVRKYAPSDATDFIIDDKLNIFNNVSDGNTTHYSSTDQNESESESKEEEENLELEKHNNDTDVNSINNPKIDKKDIINSFSLMKRFKDNKTLFLTVGVISVVLFVTFLISKYIFRISKKKFPL